MNNIFTERMSMVQEKISDFANCLDRLNDEDTIFKKLVHFHARDITDNQRFYTFNAVCACLSPKEQASIREKIQYTVTDSILHFLGERGYEKSEVKVIYGFKNFIDSSFLIQYKGKELFLFSLSDLDSMDGTLNYSIDLMGEWDKESYYQKKAEAAEIKIKNIEEQISNLPKSQEYGQYGLFDKLESSKKEKEEYEVQMNLFEENKKRIKNECERFVKDMWNYIESRKVVRSK